MIARLAILYEHPEWFQPLFAELRRRSIPFVEWRAHRLCWDETRPDGIDLVLNRMSASARWRGHEGAQFAVLAFLRQMEECGVGTVNGSHSYEYEISKSRQLSLFRRCGVPYPRTRVVNHASLLQEAARGLRFPVLIKPNCGGAGRGIQRFESLEALAAARDLDFGCDHIALVQEYVPPAEERIVRVEVLAGEVLYSMQVLARGFDLCPAHTCAPGDRKIIEAPGEIQEMALVLARSARLDVGGFEFLYDRASRRWLAYDVNPLSNFALNAQQMLGFDPYARLVDYLVRRLEAQSRLHR